MNSIINNKYGEEMEEVQLKDVPKGEYIRRTPDTSKTYIKGEYVRDEGLNKYECTNFMDTSNAMYLKGTTKVYTGFTF